MKRLAGNCASNALSRCRLTIFCPRVTIVTKSLPPYGTKVVIVYLDQPGSVLDKDERPFRFTACGGTPRR